MSNKKINCYCFNKNKDQGTKWLVNLLGPVLLDVKPAEILSFPSKNQLGCKRKDEIKSIFDHSNNINYKEFKGLNGCTKVLFYNYKLLNNTLKDTKNLRFLKELGYPLDYTLEKYLDHIIRKMEIGIMPDEIGIFLGYPLKDVIGFMGHPSLRLTKICGWRIYGNPKISDERRKAFLNAKNEMKDLLEKDNLEKFMSLVS